MIRVLSCFFIVCSIFAQNAKDDLPPSEMAASDKAPPEVDAALRARVKIFYQAHVDAKPRRADQVVAEDSKDIFFAAPKPKFESFEFIRIGYWNDFKRAQVLVACKAFWQLRGENLPVTMPITTTWKLEDGEWFWYFRESPKTESPFGTMDHNSGKPRDPNAPAAPMIPGDPMKLAQQILASIQVDKTEVMLSSFEPATAEVRIRNGMPGVLRLRADLDGAFAGLTAKLDKTELKGGETAIVKIVCEPKDRVAKPTLTLRIYTEPTNQMFPVTLMFAVPPEIEKLLPKTIRPALKQP